MTVAELIAQLQAFPADMTVVVPAEDHYSNPARVELLNVRHARPGTGETCYCDWVERGDGLFEVTVVAIEP